MYFRGKLSVDPSKITRTSVVKPTRAFGKMLFHLTAGSVGTKIERETFTAVAILQQLNRSLRAVGVSDLVRLAVNGTDYYLDEEGRDDDMVEALDRFESAAGARPTGPFECIELVAEHRLDQLKLLIEVTIDREHPPGVPPIRVVVCGTMADFARTSTGTEESGTHKVKAVLSSQEDYDQIVTSHSGAFTGFVDQLELSLDEHIGADATTSAIERCIVRPETGSKKRRQPDRRESDDDGIFYGYYGWEDSTDYLFSWGGHMHDAGLHCSDCTLVDEDGASIMTVGEEGFDASESSTLDPKADFDVPGTGDFQMADNSPYEHAVAAPSGWSDSFGSADASDASDASSCGGASSCSSCGSCGGD